MVHTSYFNCICTNPSSTDVINLDFITNFNNIILPVTSSHSVAVIGFSIPNLGTPLFTFQTGDYVVTNGWNGAQAPVIAVNNGYGVGVVNNYAQFLNAINAALAVANAGAPWAPPVMSYNPTTKLFSFTRDPANAFPWSFNAKLYSRFPTFPANFFQGTIPFAQLLFSNNVSTQEASTLWSLNDYSRLLITAPNLPFDATMSAVSQSGTPLSIRTLASFENNDMEFNRSSFVYSESGQGNWTLHDLKMSGNLQSIQLQVYAVNLFDEILPIKLQPRTQALIKLAFVRDDGNGK